MGKEYNKDKIKRGQQNKIGWLAMLSACRSLETLESRLKNLKKPLDKPNKMCYNKSTVKKGQKAHTQERMC